MNELEYKKTCTICHSLKNILEFRKDSRLKSGFGATCKSCSSARSLAWNKANAEHHKAYQAEWRSNNKEYDSARKIQWAKDNPEKKRASDAKYYNTHIKSCRKQTRLYYIQHKEKLCNYTKNWRKNNRAYVYTKNAERHAKKLQRTPNWVTNDEKLQIAELYAECRRISLITGVQHHVDHIIPLQGANVSGLHVLSNLRIIPWHENLSKHNKYTGT